MYLNMNNFMNKTCNKPISKSKEKCSECVHMSCTLLLMMIFSQSSLVGLHVWTDLKAIKYEKQIVLTFEWLH